MHGVGATPSQEQALHDEVIVLGGGPAGLAAAVLLARDAGKKVTIYEKAADLAQADEESYPIGVNPRGLRVLGMVDAAFNGSGQFGEKGPIDVASGVVDGWCIHDGTKQIAMAKSGTVMGTTRGAVVSELFKVASQTYGVAILLNHKLASADAGACTLTFERTDSGEQMVVDYADKRVLDCSGCWSKLRAAVAATDDHFTVDAHPWEISFRCLFTAPVPRALNLDEKLHYIFTGAGIYAAVLTGKRWAFSCSVNQALNPGCEWMLSDAPSEGNVAKLKAHIATHCPAAVGMLDDDEYAKFFSRRAFSGQVVKCSKLHDGERVCFLGDAAHSVIPSTGEGINSALEDVGVLLETLKSTGGGTSWFAAYNDRRVADANALSEYAAYLLEGMKAPPAERNRRTASMVLGLIGGKMGLLGPSWNDKTFGPLAVRMEPYAKCAAEWRKQMSKVQPLGNAIIWHFAKDGGKKQVRAQRKAEREAGKKLGMEAA